MRKQQSDLLEANEWLTLRQVAASLPGRPHIGTVTRWTQRPVRGRILPSRLIGGKRLVKRSDLLEFLSENEEELRSDTQTERQAIAHAQVDALLN